MPAEPDDKRAAGETPAFSMPLGLAALVFVVLASAALMLTPVGGGYVGLVELALYFLRVQDLTLVEIAVGFFVVAILMLRRAGPGGGRFEPSPRLGLGLVIAAVGLAWFARSALLFDLDLSRDEQMAVFDTQIFAKGLLFQPIPEFWRSYFHALNSLYILPGGDHSGWVSGYLPGNAAIRTVLGFVLPQSVISPMLLLVAGLALWRITLQLWPDSKSTRAVVLLVFAGSSQAIVTASTAFAMTAHLALNLVWLWLFLKHRTMPQFCAIVVGFVATGLHQPVLHPVFVAPFLLLLLYRKAWRELAIYAAGYLLIGLFWLAWPGWVVAQIGPAVGLPPEGTGVSFFERLSHLDVGLSLQSLWMMGANLLRFFAWQHLLLLPLMCAAWLHLRRDKLVLALTAGPVLMALIMLVILPPQGHGWGYRYLHGYIGSAALLAGFGWNWLAVQGQAPRRTFALASAISILLLLPLHLWMARETTAPYAEAQARIAAIDAPVVIVDDNILPFGDNLVLNRADLTNRPIRLQSGLLEPADLAGLCSKFPIAFADLGMFADIPNNWVVPQQLAASDHQLELHAAAKAAGCRVIPTGRSRL